MKFFNHKTHIVPQESSPNAEPQQRGTLEDSVTQPPNPLARPGIHVRGLRELNAESVHVVDFVVSITDGPNIKIPFEIIPRKVIRVFFEDTEFPDQDEYLQMRNGVHRVLAAIRSRGLTPEDRLLIHCHAGVSRSAALAWAIMVQMGQDIPGAFEQLWKARPKIWPNRIVLNIADSYLGLNGKLSQYGEKVHLEIEANRRDGTGGYC